MSCTGGVHNTGDGVDPYQHEATARDSPEESSMDESLNDQHQRLLNTD